MWFHSSSRFHNEESQVMVANAVYAVCGDLPHQLAPSMLEEIDYHGDNVGFSTSVDKCCLPWGPDLACLKEKSTKTCHSHSGRRWTS